MDMVPKKPSPIIKRNEGRRTCAQERIRNFSEVAIGFSKEEAIIEAARCLNCKTKPCEIACPVNIKIPEFIDLVYKDDISRAVSKIYETSLFPAICAHICPQETYCEGACVLKEKFKSVSIGRLERFAADYARKNGLIKLPQKQAETGKKVACIGLGPGSLALAAELKKYETVVAVGGGVGIAELYPIARGFKQAGNKVTSILGARNKELLILEKETSEISDLALITTDDGSKARKGLVTDALRDICEKEKIDAIFTIGLLIMMKFTAMVTREKNIPTFASLNPIMLDATGMCNAGLVYTGV